MKGRVSAGRTRAAKTAVAVVAPVTPKRRRGAFGSLGRVRVLVDGLGCVALDPVSLNTAVISPARNSLSAAVVQGKMEFDDFAKLVDLIRESSSEVQGTCSGVLNTYEHRDGFAPGRFGGTHPRASSAPERCPEIDGTAYRSRVGRYAASHCTPVICG